MDRCDIQLAVLKEDVEKYLWTFRWLWLINIVAIAWGVIQRHYDLVAFAAVSAAVAIVGAARTRLGRRLVARAVDVCLPSRRRGRDEEGEQPAA